MMLSHTVYIRHDMKYITNFMPMEQYQAGSHLNSLNLSTMHVMDQELYVDGN